MEINKKLKPVVFVQGEKRFYAPNTYAQNILLKAMSKGVTSPQELRKLAGLKSVTDVYRTLDKMAIRKEYHDALQRNGISLDYIVQGLQDLAEAADKDSVRLSSYQTLLKSLGLDKYEKTEETGKGWEEVVLAAVAKEEETKQIGDGTVIEGEIDNNTYEVKAPDMPEAARKQRESEAELAKMLYDK